MIEIIIVSALVSLIVNFLFIKWQLRKNIKVHQKRMASVAHDSGSDIALGLLEMNMRRREAEYAEMIRQIEKGLKKAKHGEGV